MTTIAQIVDVLHCLVETDGDDAWPRPTYRVFDLYPPHWGNDALTTTVDTPTRAVDDADDDLPVETGEDALTVELPRATVAGLSVRDVTSIGRGR